MEKEELLKTLESLHHDLSNTDHIEPEAERLLRAVTDDIQKLLDQKQESPEGDSKSLAAKLQSLVLSWEADHPQIARMMGRVADALNNIGI